MADINYTVASTDADLYGILKLQRANLPGSLTHEEALEQGFVTLQHNFALLKRMNIPYPHLIAKREDRVIGYALVMLPDLRAAIPALIPMFAQIDALEYAGQKLRDARYVVMGQVCIAKDYRGQGIFKRLYDEMVMHVSPHFDFILTEVSGRNTRSMRAHEKIGFENICDYTSDDGEDWSILLLRCQ